MNNFKQWDGFKGRIWKEEVNTRDFIQHNYVPYEGIRSSWKDLPKPRKTLVCTSNCRKGACERRRSGYGYRNCILTDFPWAGLHQ